MVLTSLKANFNIFYRCHVVVLFTFHKFIETGGHIKNNACAVEIKIKLMIQKHMTYENTYRDDKIRGPKKFLSTNFYRKKKLKDANNV